MVRQSPRFTGTNYSIQQGKSGLLLAGFIRRLSLMWSSCCGMLLLCLWSWRTKRALSFGCYVGGLCLWTDTVPIRNKHIQTLHEQLRSSNASSLTFTLCVCPCVCVQNISKHIEPIHVIFGGGLPFDPWRKPFDFKSNPPGARVGVRGGRNLALIIRDTRIFFEWL